MKEKYLEKTVYSKEEYIDTFFHWNVFLVYYLWEPSLPPKNCFDLLWREIDNKDVLCVITNSLPISKLEDGEFGVILF